MRERNIFISSQFCSLQSRVSSQIVCIKHSHELSWLYNDWDWLADSLPDACDLSKTDTNKEQTRLKTDTVTVYPSTPTFSLRIRSRCLLCWESRYNALKIPGDQLNDLFLEKHICLMFVCFLGYILRALVFVTWPHLSGKSTSARQG